MLPSIDWLHYDKHCIHILQAYEVTAMNHDNFQHKPCAEQGRSPLSVLSLSPSVAGLDPVLDSMQFLSSS